MSNGPGGGRFDRPQGKQAVANMLRMRNPTNNPYMNTVQQPNMPPHNFQGMPRQFLRYDYSFIYSVKCIFATTNENDSLL